MVYIISTIVASFICFLSVFNVFKRSYAEKPNKALFALSSIPYILVLALREGVGTDYYSAYVQSIVEIETGDSRFEPGYILICQLCSAITSDYHLLFAVMAALTIAATYLAIYRVSENPLLSVLLVVLTGYLMFSTNGIRQALAVAILLNSIPYLYGTNRNLVKYLLTIVLASCFHSSALLFAVFYPLVLIRLNIKRMVIILVGVVAAAGVLVGLFGQVVSLFSAQLSLYFNEATQYSVSGNMDFSDLAYCSVLITGYVYLSLNNANEDVSDSDALSNVYGWLLFSGIICCLLSNTMFIFSRAAVYFTYFGILAFPHLLMCIKERSSTDYSMILTTTLIVLCGLTGYLYGALHFSQALPYETFIEL